MKKVFTKESLQRVGTPNMNTLLIGKNVIEKKNERIHGHTKNKVHKRKEGNPMKECGSNYTR